MTPEVNSIVRVTKWASKECHKQQSGELSVSWMVSGWAYAYDIYLHDPHQAPTVQMIQELGSIVELRKNVKNQWRRGGVMVGGSVKAPPLEVPRLMEALVEAWDKLDSDIWYREFEEIHPFLDGNGRTGNILWNWHKGTLAPRDLSFPPDFWGGDRLTFTEAAC